MKALRFLPLVYIVGIDGFVFFAPYILLILTIAWTLRMMRRVEPQPVPVRVAATRELFRIPS
jgi:hypothetical protein